MDQLEFLLLVPKLLPITKQTLNHQSTRLSHTKPFQSVALLLYLHWHLDEHEEFLNAYPDPLSFELMRDAGPLFVCEASQ